jgi:hypothetical protein
LGKKVLKLIVKVDNNNRFTYIVKRNILKYLPWEIAHIGIHLMFYYNSQSLETPIWVWVTLISPQILVILNLLSIFFNGGKQSLYDWIAQTKVINTSL